MNEETIRIRLAELRQQMTNLQANVHAVDGAIQDCEYWLNVIKKGAETLPSTLEDSK